MIAQRLFVLALTGSLLFQGCARFRIQELSPEIVFRTPVVSSDSSREIPAQGVLRGRVLFNIPAHPGINSSYVFLQDYEKGLVRVYSRGSSTPFRVYGAQSREPESPGSARFFPVSLGLPGLIAAHDSGDLYIQNFPFPESSGPDETDDTPPELRIPGQLNRKAATIRPSTILWIGPDGKRKGVLGQTGSDGPAVPPFEQILRMDPGEKEDELLVLHKKDSHLLLSLYKNGKLDHSFDASSAQSSAELARYLVEVENIAKVPGKDEALASLAYRNKKTYNLEFRSIVRLSPENETPPSEITKIDEPGDYFTRARSDGGFYLLNGESDGSTILFKIYSNEGEYLNNRLVRFPGIRATWRETFHSQDGNQIYSSRVFRGNYEIYTWN